VLLCGLQRRYKMVDEKLIIAELVKAVKENRIKIENIPEAYQVEVQELINNSIEVNKKE